MLPRRQPSNLARELSHQGPGPAREVGQGRPALRGPLMEGCASPLDPDGDTETGQGQHGEGTPSRLTPLPRVHRRAALH